MCVCVLKAVTRAWLRKKFKHKTNKTQARLIYYNWSWGRGEGRGGRARGHLLKHTPGKGAKEEKTKTSLCILTANRNVFTGGLLSFNTNRYVLKKEQEKKKGGGALFSPSTNIPRSKSGRHCGTSHSDLSPQRSVGVAPTTLCDVTAQCIYITPIHG